MRVPCQAILIYFTLIPIMHIVLSIAGSDSIGGAGMQADLKAFASMDLHGASAFTAITAQNTQRVAKIKPLPVSDVIAQINAVFDDAEISAVKTGMLYSAEIAQAVSKRLSGIDVPLVVDPVMVAGVGDKLHSKNLLAALKEHVIPLATIVTPNRIEAELISSMTIDHVTDAERACRIIAELGAKAVLLKGGHFDGDEVVDLLYHDGKMFEFAVPRLPINVHGGGCTLASYIAGDLAKGMSVKASVLDAKRRINDAIALSIPIGKGPNVINPMASKQKHGMREERIETLRAAVDQLQKKLPIAWIPQVGINFVYALPAPQGYDEVCGVEGRIVRCGNGPKRVGDIRFNTSHHVARMVLIANRHDPTCLSALNLRYSDSNIEKLKINKLRMVGFDRKLEKEELGKMDDGLKGAIEQTGFVPDIVFDTGGIGKEAMIRVFGLDPSDILRKIGPILT